MPARIAFVASGVDRARSVSSMRSRNLPPTTSIEPIKQGGTRPADVQEPGRRRGETGHNRGVHGGGPFGQRYCARSGVYRLVTLPVLGFDVCLSSAIRGGKHGPLEPVQHRDAAPARHLFGWVPVCLALGIGWYFSLAAEPSIPLLWATALAVAALAVVARALPEVTAPFAVGLALVLLGLLLAAFRAHSISAPVLGWRYYGAVEGRVVALDRSQSDVPRVTLDQVRLERVPPARTPSRVRVSLHSKLSGAVAPKPEHAGDDHGSSVAARGPVEPGGFDFQRHAWFAGLGAVGYARVPLLGIAEPAERDPDLALFRLRMAASARVRAHLPGDIGGFAAAITTGDRSAISQAALQNLRSSNLAHLLAISGLHMGLLSAVVFGAARLILALHPVSATGWPSRSIAAAAALIAATGYLALSGGNVATERAYIMRAVALCALMIGRRAISLRAVAVAGLSC